MKHECDCPPHPIFCVAENKQSRNSSVPKLPDIKPSDPYFLPGYTGCTPKTGPQRLFEYGKTYGHYTHRQLSDHPIGGSRLCQLPQDQYIKPVETELNPLHNDCCTDPVVETVEVLPEVPEGTFCNPHRSIEPHFIPGYTGFVPGSGIKRSNGIGETYGRMSHILLCKNDIAGNRLRPIYEPLPNEILREEDMKFFCNRHELNRIDIRRRVGSLPGYAEHIPRAWLRHGKNSTTIANNCIAEFEKMLNG
ncbi:protein FAM166B-like [Uloborus diversus]|uniref:protein FAM166B-like n=1 Tax=Uloborus diversus TaxID=327109 RepID=UPI002408F9D9|nr:protein FAM166B-like [Uloborus diversus]